MSIMGMREWLHNNRVAMLIVFVLLLVGLLMSYGNFGSSATYTASDYEKMVATAREAYEADPTEPANVQALAAVLGEYAAFLSKDGATKEEIDAVDNEALEYYDEYYGLMVLEATETYNANKNYSNAYIVASYLAQRAQAQSLMNEDSTGVSNKSTEWMITALNHRVTELGLELNDDPNNQAILADVADAKAALGYYHSQLNAKYDLTSDYQAAIDLYMQALENCGDDVPAATKSDYYQKAAAYAYNIEKKDLAEQYYQAALELTPEDYNTNVAMASFLLNAERYDEALTLLQNYRATMADDDTNATNVDSSIAYVQSMIEAVNATDDAETDKDDGDASADTDTEVTPAN